MDIVCYGVHGEITGAQICFKGCAIAKGGEIEEGARAILFGNNDATCITFIVEDHEISIEPIGNASGEGNAVRRQSKIKVM